MATKKIAQQKLTFRRQKVYTSSTTIGNQTANGLIRKGICQGLSWDSSINHLGYPAIINKKMNYQADCLRLWIKKKLKGRLYKITSLKRRLEINSIQIKVNKPRKTSTMEGLLEWSKIQRKKGMISLKNCTKMDPSSKKIRPYPS